MKNDLVSIITPTYNSENFILETIQSVQKQTHTNWEMLIVDDCSTDNTFNIVSKQAILDTRIKVFKLSKNSGAGIARQFALDSALGEFVAFLDSDDLWKQDKLLKQIEYLKNTNTAITYSFYELIDEDGKLLNCTITSPLIISYKKLFYSNYIGNLTGIYSVSKLGKINISNYRKRQDWIMWLTILKEVKTVSPVPEVLARYRVRKDSISSSKIKLLQSNYLVYRMYHKQKVMQSIFSMIVFLYTHFIIKKRYIVKT